jgi:hypothetical protein
MSDQAGEARAREAVGVFDDAAAFEAATRELLAAGFAEADLGLLASQAAVEAKLGHRYERVEELEDEPRAPRLAFRERPRGADEIRVPGPLAHLPVVIAGGVLVASSGALAAALGVGALAGGLIGTALGSWLDRRHALYLQEQLDRGGILLWVRTADPEAERKAMSILQRHSAHDIHIHGLPGAD